MNNTSRNEMLVGVDIELMREEQIAKKEKPKYDRCCRDKGLKNGVIRFLNPVDGNVSFSDYVKGDISISNSGIAGSHIKSLNSHGMVKIKDSEVSQMDIDRVIETAQAITLPPDQQVLHILTQEYVVDQQHDIIEPIGMSGMKLEVKVHIITGVKILHKIYINA